MLHENLGRRDQVGSSHVRAPVPGTAADDMDMRRMHKPQELNVRAQRILRVCDQLLIIHSEYTLP
jgi:hypothetical protein